MHKSCKYLVTSISVVFVVNPTLFSENVTAAYSLVLAGAMKVKLTLLSLLTVQEILISSVASLNVPVH